MKQFLSFVHKEFLHILRDRRTILLLLVMPIILMVLFGFAISTEVKNARFAVLDLNKTVATRQITEAIAVSDYFTLSYDLTSVTQIDSLFRRGLINIAVVFGSDFDRHPTMQIIADASDPNTATITTAYASAITKATIGHSVIVSQDTRFLYNPSMLSSYNFVPGVMGMILMMICAMMTAISIVREKEMGTMEVLLVSPVHPFWLILAKLIPYFVLSIINLATILLLSVYVLGVPIAGSLVWLILLSLLFIIVTLSLGLFISTLVRTQVVAMMISGMVLMMPTVLLSGMMFPIDNMPMTLQVISTAMPARWFIEGVRKLMIQGVDVSFVVWEFVILGGMAIALIGLSLKKFKIRL